MKIVIGKVSCNPRGVFLHFTVWPSFPFVADLILNSTNLVHILFRYLSTVDIIKRNTFSFAIYQSFYIQCEYFSLSYSVKIARPEPDTVLKNRKVIFHCRVYYFNIALTYEKNYLYLPCFLCVIYGSRKFNSVEYSILKSINHLKFCYLHKYNLIAKLESHLNNKLFESNKILCM